MGLRGVFVGALLLIPGPALLLPWIPCDFCSPEHIARVRDRELWDEAPGRAAGWACPKCRDEGHVSLVQRAKVGRDLEPVAEALVDGAPSEQLHERIRVLLDGAGVGRRAVRNHPRHIAVFIPGEAFLLLMSPDGGRRGAGMAFLFDLDGKLLDRVEIEDEDQDAPVQLQHADPSTSQGAILWGDVRFMGKDGGERIELRALRNGSEVLASGRGVVALAVRDHRFVAP